MYKDMAAAQAGMKQFNLDVAALLKTDRQSKDEGHERSYKVCAAGYRVAYALEESPTIRAQLLATASIADASDNRFAAPVKLLYRNSKGKPDPSRWKYGNIWRYAFEDGWHPDQFVTKIKALTGTLKDGRKVTKLQAAELLDREAHGGGEDKAFVDAAFAYLRDQPELGAIPGEGINAEGRKDGDWVSLAAQWDAEKGLYVVRLPVSTNSETVGQSVKKEVIKAFERHTEALFRELTVHNATVTQLNQMPEHWRKAHAERIRGKGTFDWDELNAKFAQPTTETGSKPAAKTAKAA